MVEPNSIDHARRPSAGRALYVWLGAGCVGLLLLVVAGVALTVHVATRRQAAPPVVYDIPTEAEVDALGRRIASEITVEGSLDGLIDWDEVVRRGLASRIDIDRRELRDFTAGARDEGLQGVLRDGVLAGGSFTFRGVVQRESRPVARFRFLVPAGGVNFHDLVVGRAPNGELRIIDVHIAVTSEYLSETMGRMAAGMLASRPDLLERLRGEEGEWLAHASEFRAMAEAVRAGRADEALAIYDRLPETMKRERSVLLLRVQAGALLTDDARYLEILEDVERRAPGDAGLRFALFDAHFLREDWEACIESLVAMRDEYPDPAIEALQARVYVLWGDPTRALVLADHAIAAEPALIDGHDVALLAALALPDRERAWLELQILTEQFGVDPTVLAGEPGYEGLTDLRMGMIDDEREP